MPELDEARRWLVAIGQIEQAVLDAGLSCGELATAATLAAADVFLETRQAQIGGSALKLSVEKLRRALSVLEDRLDGRELEVRVPEGFAWYALYPDSYAQTAERWASHFGFAGGRVCIIGLRSIGTTLAAVVRQVLERHEFGISGYATVRPFGDPFQRRVVMPPGITPAAQNIIVDEGPGLSGSSMLAVARALQELGALPEFIHLFAGHTRGPGSAVCPESKVWWSSHRVWVTDLDATRIGGQPVPRMLAAVAERVTRRLAVAPAEPLGTSHWQALAHLPSLPRAVAPLMESPKKIVNLRSGDRILCKFTGFALTGSNFEQNDRSVPGAAARCHGWALMRWIEGTRLRADAASPAFVADFLAPQIAASSDRELQPNEVQQGISRIADALLAWAEARQHKALRSLIAWAAEREFAQMRGAPQHAYGDGRLAPHEWVCTGDGIVKVDGFGHTCDHAWVGQQPLAWDLAGAEIEWELDWRLTNVLRSTVAARSGYQCSAETYTFYKAGYCAFRAAAAWYAAEGSFPEPLRDHLLNACAWYEARLQSSLALLGHRRL